MPTRGHHDARVSAGDGTSGPSATHALVGGGGGWLAPNSVRALGCQRTGGRCMMAGRSLLSTCRIRMTRRPTSTAACVQVPGADPVAHARAGKPDREGHPGCWRLHERAGARLHRWKEPRCVGSLGVCLGRVPPCGREPGVRLSWQGSRTLGGVLARLLLMILQFHVS